MAGELTVGEVLKRAIQKEIESQNLYSGLSRKMTDDAAKDAFRQLYRQEQGHQKRLEQYQRGELKGGSLSRGQAVDYRIAEYLDQSPASPDMKLRDVFLLAANREKAAHTFYISFAALHPTGRVRKLLEDLAAQELEHKQRVEFLFTEVAFPQTDGG
jgi:rubrerythrin